jgi:Ras-related protein Rab-5C
MKTNKNTCKLAIVGEAGIGKSSIVERIVRNQFSNDTNSTIGAAYSTFTYDGTIYQIWDTAGQERYQSLIPMYLRGSKIVLVVYDITSTYSIDKIKKHWYDFAVKNVDNDCIIMLVGNKWDIHQFNNDNIERSAREFALKHNLIHHQVSAKQGTNMASLFKSIDNEVKKKEIANTKFDENGIEISKNSGLVLIDWDKLSSKKDDSMISSCTGDRCSIQ